METERKKSVLGYVKMAAIALILCGVVVLCVMGYRAQRNSVCRKIEVSVSYQGENKPFDENDVLGLLDSNRIRVVGEEKHNVDLAAVYDVLGKVPFVKTIKPVYFSGNQLNIEIELHRFLARVYASDGRDFYLCEDGSLIPYTNRICERLLLVEGNVPKVPDSVRHVNKVGPTMKRIWSLASVISANPFYSAQFKQVYVNDQKEFELIATMGKHTVLLGDGTNAEEQLFQLLEAYKQGISYMDPEKYCQLDLRYKNRIIAKKR